MSERLWLAALFCTLLTAHADTTSVLRDPTRPSGWLAPADAADADRQQPVALQLQAVFSHAGKRTALINGHRVGQGDRIGDAEVIRIEPGTVTLRVDGETVELASAAAPVKSPTKELEGYQ